MHEERRERLQHFAEWASRHITGDEKGQAQIFLDRLFQAFAQPGVLDVGGEPEFRVRPQPQPGPEEMEAAKKHIAHDDRRQPPAGDGRRGLRDPELEGVPFPALTSGT
jgi:hypothetical protein